MRKRNFYNIKNVLIYCKDVRFIFVNNFALYYAVPFFFVLFRLKYSCKFNWFWWKMEKISMLKKIYFLEAYLSFKTYSQSATLFTADRLTLTFSLMHFLCRNYIVTTFWIHRHCSFKDSKLFTLSRKTKGLLLDPEHYPRSAEVWFKSLI